MPGSIVFPVRYVSGGIPVQTTSCGLNALGVEVRSLAPPRPGSRLSMALYLPGARVPEVAVARVARLTGEGSFWAEFMVIDTAARMRIRDLAAALPQDGASGKLEHRTFDRHVVELRVRFRTTREFAVEHATNLSRGGVFIRSEDPPPKGEPVEVHLELPDGDVASSRGVVVHSSRKDPKGVGVQFADSTDRFRERIDRYMETLNRAAAAAAAAADAATAH